jgi:DNA-binding NarL/FixJ family response regulator
MGPLAPHRTAAPTLSRLLLFTDRPALEVFFRPLTELLEVAPVSLETLGSSDLGDLPVAIVDISLDPAVAIEVCRDLHRRRADLPIVAVVCCPHAVTPWALRGLLGGAIRAVLDLREAQEGVAQALERVARGASVLHVQLRHGHGEILADLLAAKEQWSETQLRLLELVVQGLPDHEIGKRLHLSPHTIKHHIEHLRHELRLRNRIELAAWAGRNGFYDAGAGSPPVTKAGTDQRIRPDRATPRAVL